MNVEQQINRNLVLEIAALLNNFSKDELLFINKKIYTKIYSYLKQSATLQNLQKSLLNILYSPDDQGYIKLNLQPFKSIDLNLTLVATIICFVAGIPFSLYENKPYWEPLSVKLGAKLNRMHGMGCNPFHIDLLTRSKPPEVIAFLGVRVDPLGGGYTELADLLLAIKQLSSIDYGLLTKKIFKYWPDQNVCHVGRYLTSYRIIPTDTTSGFVRYTAKMLPHLDGTNKVIIDTAIKHTVEIKRALENLQKILNNNALQFLVNPDELLLFNQRRFAHSRTMLGTGQANIPFNNRRLMMQGYLHKPDQFMAI